MHVEQAAVGACARCGDYACADCATAVADTQVLCRGCGVRLVDVRTRHLKLEERVEGLVYLHFFAAAFYGLAAFFSFIAPFSRTWRAVEAVRDLDLAIPDLAYLAVVGLLNAIVGLGLRARMPWARWLGVALAALGIWRFACAGVVNLYVLFVLFSKGISRVMSPQYTETIKWTPHLDRKRADQS